MKGWTSFERRQSFKIWHNIQTCMYTMTLDCIFAFRLNKVKKAGELGMVQYQFLILDHGFPKTLYIRSFISQYTLQFEIFTDGNIKESVKIR